MNKHLLPLLLVTGLARAEGIVIEERPLSPPPPAPVVATAPAASEATTSAPTVDWETYQTLQQLQTEVRQLRGQVEEQTQQIQTLQDALRSRYNDLDQRVSALKEQLASQPPAPATAPEAPAAPVAPPPAASNIEEEKQAYLAAYESFRKEGPDKAVLRLLGFVQKYPNSTFTPNAIYWLGEAYASNSPPDFASARRQFETLLGKYANHAKVPASLYRLGQLADLQGQPDQAKARMTELLSRFPQSPEAALAKTWLDEAAKPKTPPKPTAKPATKPTPAKPAKKAP